MKIYKSPESTIAAVGPRIFLAGSIEMGKAIDWQTKISNDLSGYGGSIFNPRRDDWDSSWVQSASNAKFNEQVTWEMNNLDAATHIIFYFDPKTQSPITLLELGLMATTRKKIFMYCPEGFWRRGNVEMVCNKYSIKMYDTYDELVSAVANSVAPTNK